MTYPLLNIKGEVHYDKTSLALYATDASMYQMLPNMVVIPKDEDDLLKIVDYARTNNLTILPRGSATSLAGQTVNSGIVIDFTKNFNKIVNIDLDKKQATVMPGVTRDQLNVEIAKHNLHFAPDPATSNRCTFGGMIANNSSGTKSILYGKTIDHVIQLKIMLSDGTILILKDEDAESYNAICQQNDREGEIYRNFRDLIFKNSSEIEHTYPKVMRRVCGYALDEFILTARWNLAKVITGSEGTLALILEATVNLEPLPQYQNMMVIHYDNRHKGIDTVAEIVKFGPAAVEVLDYNVLTQSKLNAITKKYHDSLIIGEPDIVLTVEFYGQTHEEIDQKANSLKDYLTTVSSAYAYPLYYEKNKINDGLNLRKDGLGLLMGKADARKPQAFIEDPAIPLEHLSEYVRKVTKFCEDRGVEMVIYAHASVGVLHIRPFLDLTDPKDIKLMKEISDECFTLVKKYKGSWSGEHGDGRNRGHRIKDYYGETIYGLFKQIKTLFDPFLMLNPNIIIDTPPMDQNLRYGPTYKDQEFEFAYHYRKDHSFKDLVHMCSGVGACRKTIGGTMCPSYRATLDEKDSTRGRANILRLAMSRQYGFSDLASKEVLEVMDLCLSCKACKTECPSNVDMAKLKSEVLQIKYETRGMNMSERLPKYAPILSRTFSGVLAHFVNFIQHTSLFRLLSHHLFNVHKQRILPDYSHQTFVHWAKANNNFTSKNKVVIFIDTYLNNHQPEVGIKAVKLLNDCGYEVILKDLGCCQRPLISNGHLHKAKKEGSTTSENLRFYLDQNIPILTFEPSCHTALTDDLPDLIDDAVLGQKMYSQIKTIEVFLAEEYKSGRLKGSFTCKVSSLAIHGHCHQKASYGTDATKYLLGLTNTNFTELNTGCCGMAGSFGYEKKHFDLSKKIAQSALIPGIDANPDAIIVAHGFSCKHQIADFRGKETKHVVEVLDFLKL
jgi:FAD/FMN-containing dehydrogenase/Fe-S oxidoreductase